MRRFFVTLALLSTGCLLHNISPQELLTDSVVGLNDEARWTRMDLAVQRVAPAYRDTFTSTHHRWGRGIQIADVEILNAEMAAEGDGAVSTVAISWYSYSTMTLRRSVIRQEWRSASRSYLLTSERVIEGDATLLEPPERRETEAEEERALEAHTSDADPPA